ncbi:alpha/beta fold hydrolase, partial [Nonomuraea guangzhouensis]
HQIKLRGHRIEPAEIEHTLTTHPTITNALITLHHDRLIAYLVPTDQDDGIPASTELRDHLRATLPDHMIPTTYIELPAFPRTPNGKIDRRALPAPDTTRPDLTDTYQAPTTPTQQLLATIWTDLLNLDQIGTTDNFFDLGGHSLLATQAITRIRTSGYEVSLGDLFDHPTIAELAQLMVMTSASDVMPDHRSMVRIRWGSTSPAVFSVHSVTGAAGDFTGLAGHLGPEQQWFALQARGLDGTETPVESVERMAEMYLDEVLAVQDTGPYLFAAWSMGGYVAVEMARQAEARGLDVGGVFLVGPPLHRVRRGIDKARDTRQLRALMRRLDEVIAGEPGTLLAQADEELLLELWPAQGDLLADLRAGEKQALRVARVVAANSLAVLHHRGRRGLKPYGGRVVLFVPQDDPEELQVRLLEQWRSTLREEPEIVYVPGTHEAVIRDEGAARVGARLRAEVARHEETDQEADQETEQEPEQETER